VLRFCRPRFFLSVEVLSALFRPLFLAKLRAAYQAGELQFFGKHARLVDRRAFAAYLAPLWNADWVVYCKRPFGGPKEVLRYLARYTHRVAISNRRLIASDENSVPEHSLPHDVDNITKQLRQALRWFVGFIV
jgi:Putative transposase